jgi:ABC-2 type transport system permease protein
MRLTWKIAVASFKMFFRQREALIWAVLLPLFTITLFGFVKFDGMGRLSLGLVNEAGEKSQPLIEALKNVKTLKVAEGSQADEMEQLAKGERDMVLVLPAGFDPATPRKLEVFVNDGRPQEVQLGQLILQRVVDELSFARLSRTDRIMVVTVAVKSRNLTYIDFLVPGVLSMSIMQMGIFGVAFGFVHLKKRGILRRLWVTPIRPGSFVLGQVTMRLTVVMMQIAIIVTAGVLFFHLHFIGSIASLLLIGVLGGVVFLSIGFAIAGISKSEDQVAPIANLISLPMMLLSGIFFSRSNLPGIIHTITDYFPLTYLADAMRSVAIDGSSLIEVGPQLIGLLVWCLLSTTIAVKLFRWE